MRCLLPVVLASLAAVAGCGGTDCAQSSDIQVTLDPDANVPVSTVVRLRVVLSVPGGPMGANEILVGPDKPLKSTGSTFLLRPDMTPAGPFSVSLVVQAYDVGGGLVALGSSALEAQARGCNRMTVHLTALPGGGDMSVPPGSDLAGVVAPDMTGCVGGVPDEDADGRANSCDACPADYEVTPVDSDGDRLPDACDPNPTTATNVLLYFDPFDADSGHWSGGNAVTGSTLLINTAGSGSRSASNATDTLPANVRAQSIIATSQIYGSNPADTGIFLGTSANLSNADGVFCALTANSGSPTVTLFRITNGGGSGPAQSLGISALEGTIYRLRLTQHSGDWTCEAMSTAGGSPVTVTTTSFPIPAPLIISLINDNTKSNFYHVVAESVVP